MNNPTRSKPVSAPPVRAAIPAFLATALFLGLCLNSSAVLAIPYLITIDTSSLSGSSAQLAFDLYDGGTPANTVTISSFSTDGALGSSSITGGASGNLGSTVTLNDSAFTNEYLANITLGTYLSFVFEATGNPPDAGSSPDAFAFSLLDSSGLPITSTADPSGVNSLLGQDINGAGTQPTPYSGSNPSVPVTVGSVPAVPEPSCLWLLVPGLWLLFRFSRTLRVAV